MRLVIALAVVGTLLLLVLCSGVAFFAGESLLPIGEDSWRHYQSGGSFVTASPSLSDDEGQIVFATPISGHGDIYIADLATSTARRLTTTDACETSPYFLPGSQQLVFQREQVPCRHIWLLDLQTGQERQLTRGRVLDDIASVSPTGKHIVIYRSTNWGNGRVIKPYLLDVDSRVVTESPNGLIPLHPFANGKVLDLAAYGQQVVIREKGAEPREIESPPGYKMYPNQSAKGNKAAIFIIPPQQHDRLYDIWLFDAETEQLTQVNVTLPAD